MQDCRKFYINGNWTGPREVRDLEVVNPATEESIATISLGGGADLDAAVAAAKQAFDSYSETTVDVRLTILRRVIDVYEARLDEMAETISLEMGAPLSL